MPCDFFYLNSQPLIKGSLGDDAAASQSVSKAPLFSGGKTWLWNTTASLEVLSIYLMHSNNV